MIFPPEIVTIISEYAKPRTRPNWRQSKPIISSYKLFLLATEKVEQTRVYTMYDSLLSNIKETEWFFDFETIAYRGLDKYYSNYFREHGPHANIRNIFETDGFRDAMMINYLCDL
jgi:hypothetical protein